ncbi:MAG: hypothetical protein N2C12_18680 [Planctomycetales bacterium]
MARQFQISGLCVGIVLGAILTVFVVRTTNNDRDPELPRIDFSNFIPVQATATTGNESWIAATGQIDDDVEGIFFLQRPRQVGSAVVRPHTM